MKNPITVLAPIKLASGKTESDLLAASAKFQAEFVSKQPGVLRRELVRKNAGEFLDIIQFRSQADFEDVMEKEQSSPVCHEFFETMDMDPEAAPDEAIAIFESLETYENKV